MGASAHQIETHIQETRDDLDTNFRELEQKFRSMVNWKLQFERHTAAFIGLAFGGGLLFSAILSRARVAE